MNSCGDVLLKQFGGKYGSPQEQNLIIVLNEEY
jgi:hypothetical protein